AHQPPRPNPPTPPPDRGPESISRADGSSTWQYVPHLARERTSAPGQTDVTIIYRPRYPRPTDLSTSKAAFHSPASDLTHLSAGDFLDSRSLYPGRTNSSIHHPFSPLRATYSTRP